MCFFVEFRKLNAVSIGDAYQIPGMDECKDSLGYVTVFETLEANCGELTDRD